MVCLQPKRCCMGECISQTDTGHSMFLLIYPELSYSYLPNCKLILSINQMAMDAGEELLGSVANFQHGHCLIQDITIGQ